MERVLSTFRFVIPVLVSLEIIPKLLAGFAWPH
jgi:hypothetical protein